MEFLQTILYILLFIVFLSTLIIVHELGHLAAAKAFNVYCLEYSIGMGPLLFKRKRKNGETQFSLRAIPFGGYVSMYGEGVELPEGVEVPPERSLNNIKWWKRAIILVAGVTMNSVLALTFFFISNCIPQQDITYINQVSVAESSVAYNAGFRNEDIFKLDTLTYYDDVANIQRTFYLADLETTLDGNDSVKYATCFNYASLSNYKHLDLSEYIFMYELKLDGEKYVPDFSKYVKPENFEYATVHLTKRVPGGEDNKLIDGDIITIRVEQSEGVISSFGLSLYLETTQLNAGQAFVKSFKDFGESSVLLVRAIGDLFTKPSSWQDTGGIIAVAVETTGVLQNFGFARFLYVWAFISVNLAVFNLLPFPGLDGWQLLVTFVEAATRKKIPEKVKNIVSFIGLALLLLLMGALVVKDLLRYVFVAVAL